MDHGHRVRWLQSLNHIADAGNRFLHAHRSLLVDEVLERFSRHQLHHNVGAARIFLGGQHEDAARMHDPAGQPPFLAKPLHGLGRTGKLLINELERHAAAGCRLLRLVDGPHAAGAQGAKQAIASNLLKARRTFRVLARVQMGRRRIERCGAAGLRSVHESYYARLLHSRFMKARASRASCSSL
jgi:hypothetical protein